MTISFNEIGLNANLQAGLKKQGITLPTEIQASTIPLVLEKKDVIAQSQTGSGKTLAYLLPLFQNIDSTKREMQAIILAPTHELVMQVNQQIKSLAVNSDIPVTSLTIMGEVNIARQIEKLREKPHIIVGSAGRILELIKRKKINAQTVKSIIVDEADKLLDQNNLPLIRDVIKTTLKDRQLMFFSAHINDKTSNAARELTQQATLIKIQEKGLINPNISHMYFLTERRDKLEILRKLIAAMKPKKAFVFINKTEDTQEVTTKLQYHNYRASGIYGKATKEERQKAIEGFRSGEAQILVASDIAARGLDIRGVTHIFNLDLPEDSKEYLHRVGRTGRNGIKGIAASIVTEQELKTLKKYQKEFGVLITERLVYKGTIIEPREEKSN